MKKLILLLTIIMLFSVSIILNGCSDKTKVAATDQESPKLTIEDIKKNYTDTNIKNIQNIGKDYVLIESQQETFANKFDLYNLNTGDMDTMPTSIDFVTLEKIENENYLVFLSNGKNSESPFAKAPYLIKCVRIKNEIDKADDFIALYEDKYLPLDYSIQLGSKEESQMSNINITFDGIEVLFKAIKGKEVWFYADATDISPTKISYDKDKKQLTFEIACKELGEKLKAANKVTLSDNQYISAYEITQNDNKIFLTLDLKDTAKQYLFKIKRLPDGTPYFHVSLSMES